MTMFCSTAYSGLFEKLSDMLHVTSNIDMDDTPSKTGGYRPSHSASADDADIGLTPVHFGEVVNLFFHFFHHGIRHLRHCPR